MHPTRTSCRQWLIPLIFLLALATGSAFPVYGQLAASSPASFSVTTEPSDAEATTLELTGIAVNMLISRARGSAMTLKATEIVGPTFQRDLQAERASLEESIALHAGRLSEKTSQGNLEALKLDRKILESRRDIVQSQVSALEDQVGRNREQLQLVEADLSEGRTLLEELLRRKKSLSILPREEHSALDERKLSLIADLHKARETLLSLLGDLRTLLGKRVQTLAEHVTIGKALLALYGEFLPKFTRQQREFEEKLQAATSQDLENKARNRLEAVRREQAGIASSLMDIEQRLLSTTTAEVGFSSRKNLTVLEREALLAQKEALNETSGFFERQLQGIRLQIPAQEFERSVEKRSLPDQDLGRLQEEQTRTERDLIQQLELVTKRQELFSANVQLLTKTLGDLDNRKPKDESPEMRDEIKLRRQHLKAVQEASSQASSQKELLRKILSQSQEFSLRLQEFQKKRRERRLFGRKFRSWSPVSWNVTSDFLKSAPDRIKRLTLQAFEELEGLNGVSLFLLALVGTILLHRYLSNLFLEHPVTRLTVNLPIPELWNFLGLRLQENTFWLALLIPLAGASLFSDASALLLALPLSIVVSLIGYRCIHPLIALLRPALPESIRFARQILLILTVFFPLLWWLRILAGMPELLAIVEMFLAIVLIIPTYSLVRQHPEFQKLAKDWLDPQSLAATRVLGWMYRFSGFGFLAALFLAVYGYQNLALWLTGQVAAIFTAVLLVAVGRPAADLLAQHWFGDPAIPKTVDRKGKASFLQIIFRKLFRAGIWVLAFVIVFKMAGFSREFPLLGPVGEWLGTNGSWMYTVLLRSLVIFVGASLVLDFFNTVGESILAYIRLPEHAPNNESERRASTLVQIFKTTTRVITFSIAGIMVLREVGMDVQPLLTGAGIVGVALGFGSQSLIKDFFAGFFILVENQFRVGDVIEINGKSGIVERINLKTTVLRAVDGSIFIIPNGAIDSVKNMTFSWSRAVLDIGIAYDSDVDKAISLLQLIGDELHAHPQTGQQILERPEVLGVEKLDDSAVVLRMIVKTRPLSQWEIARAFRKRILEVFRKEGIEIPFPQQVVTLQADPALAKALGIGEHSAP